MEWSGQKEFGASGAVPFLVDGAEAGTLKSHGPLAFLKVCVQDFTAMRDIVNSILVTLFFWLNKTGIRGWTHGAYGSTKSCTYNAKKLDARETDDDKEWG